MNFWDMQGKYIITVYGPILFYGAYDFQEIAGRRKIVSSGYFRVVRKPNSPLGYDVICHGEREDKWERPSTDSIKIKALIAGIMEYDLAK